MNWDQLEKMNKDYEKLELNNKKQVARLKRLITNSVKKYMTYYQYNDKFLVFSCPKLIIDIFKLLKED